MAVGQLIIHLIPLLRATECAVSQAKYSSGVQSSDALGSSLSPPPETVRKWKVMLFCRESISSSTFELLNLFWNSIIAVCIVNVKAQLTDACV